MQGGMVKFFQKKIFWLLAIAIGVRLFYGMNYPPRSVPDTEGYFRTGEQLVSGDYSDYNGKRPPVYPLLTAVAAYDLSRIVWLQAAMGVVAAVILFRIFSLLAGSETVGFLLALTQALNPSQVLFEFSGVSETTCTLLIVLTVWFTIRMIEMRSTARGINILVSGLLASLVILTRGQYLPLPFLITPF